jgi:hypothetical protein
VWPFLFDSQEGLEDLVVEVEREGGGKHRGESSLLICIHFLHKEGWMCTDFLSEHYWIF